MVLNFFQLRNYTPFTFQLINNENPKDNYDVGPWVTTARGDMWLAQGEGAKGVSVLAFSDGSASRSLLYMWDHDSALRYRIGGQTWTRAISVNGSKDFSIDIDNTTLKFVCYNGSFNAISDTTVTIMEWKDLITNYFEELVSDSATLCYARKFAGGNEDTSWNPGRPATVTVTSNERTIQRPTQAQKQAITNLVAMWEADYLEHNRRQGTIYSDGNGWRIDLQDNGAVERNGMHFYNIAVQYRGGRDNVFAHIMLPVGYVIGRRRIRNALLNSMNTSQVTVIIPPESGYSFVHGIPYTSDRARTSWAVQSLQWECTDASSIVWK